jgi:predicted Rossmann-fold nucleotide-binding protein
MKKNKKIEEIDNLIARFNDLLPGMMQMAVPIHIEELKKKGGPDEEDMKKAQEISAVLGERGDILLYGGGKPGECADQVNRTARAIAVLAFVPGGITIFGSHFEAKISKKELKNG